MEYKTDLDKLRHSCSHIMAQAVQELWPGTKVTIGPAIETGFYYDFGKEEPFTDEDLKKIEKQMRGIIARNPEFKRSSMKKDDAIKLFKEKEESFKVELIENLEDEEISIYHTADEWFDLCKGPHVENAGEIKAFKLLSVAGAYWRGDERNPMLQRIYGTAFFKKEDLKAFLAQLVEAEKRDHRKLGPKLDLFNFYHEHAGAGLVFYHPAGAMLRRVLEDYIYKEHFKRDYELVSTPHILKGKLWEVSGHADHYRENMYFFDVNNEEYAVKPMNCPGHNLIYKSKLRSYKELPVRFFELGNVYRQEKAGVLHGLLRVRGFTQDDAHIYCREDQIKDEVKAVIDFVFHMMKDFGFENINIELSTRPDDYIGDLKAWEIATNALEESLKEKELDFDINEGDGAFYGPKIDFKLRDAIGRQWQCATVQCDFSLPERFDLSYINEEGVQERPIMIHRALLGSLERFMGTLIEHYGGAFPVWLAPVQVMIIPINDEHLEFATQLGKEFKEKDLRVVVDNRRESLGKRIREGTIKKIPYLLIVGKKEVEEKNVSVRSYSKGDQGSLSSEDFTKKVSKEIADKH